MIEIFTDGACSGNPGPGGWAALLRHKDTEKMISGHEAATTNNRMELMAAIAALSELKRHCEIKLYTDSEYVRKGITEWVQGWKKRGWKTAAKAPVKNQDLWQELDLLAQQHQIEWIWVKGHSDHVENNRVDEEARKRVKG